MRLATAALALLLASAPVSAAEWRTYVNGRYGTTVDIPFDVFLAEPEAENGDGRRFVSRDGSASLTVFAGANVDRRSLSELVRAARVDAADERVTYERKGGRWYVLSGYAGPKVFYRKLLFSPDREVVHTIEIVYPAVAKPLYDPLTARIANSLSAGP